jgi:hypothetical protein
MMTLATSGFNDDEASGISIDSDVYRQLIQQFYESSILRYGVDSEQSQMLKMHLAAQDSQG